MQQLNLVDLCALPDVEMFNYSTKKDVVLLLFICHPDWRRSCRLVFIKFLDKRLLWGWSGLWNHIFKK